MSRFPTGRYGHTALALNSENVIKIREATYSAKPTIMQPPESLLPPTPRNGYKALVLPNWCNYNEVCDGVLTTEYQKRMKEHLPLRQRSNTISDRSIARFR